MNKPGRYVLMKCLLWIEGWTMPFWRWILQRRLQVGKETTRSVVDKLMIERHSSGRPVPQAHPLIWGHAVGVGELLALLGLFKTLSTYLPQHHFLLTSHSRTSGEALGRQALPDHFHHQFAPIDHPQVLQLFLDHWQPAVACWSETDLWPGMVTAAARRGMPMLMFNVRLDSRKSDRIKQWNGFYRPLLTSFTRLYPQNEVSAGHLKRLGYGLQLAPVCGNIKALAPALSYEVAASHHWRNLLLGRLVWLLASSHEGEEAIALQAHQALLAQHPQALLLIVPRDVFRGAEIARLAAEKGMKVALRSTQDTLQAAHAVYVADTMGELGLWYALCPVALVGGSLVPIGGHNPYEALAAGCAVLTGPQVHHFSESYEDLLSNGLANMVRDADQLASAVASVWARGPNASRDTASVSLESGDMPELLQDILQALKAPSRP